MKGLFRITNCETNRGFRPNGEFERTLRNESEIVKGYLAIEQDPKRRRKIIQAFERFIFEAVDGNCV